jgi:hypothetical protein
MLVKIINILTSVYEKVYKSEYVYFSSETEITECRLSCIIKFRV